MADKPDLSDLKARLGLTSPSSASMAPKAGPPPGAAPPMGGPPMGGPPAGAPPVASPPMSAPPMSAPPMAQAPQVQNHAPTPGPAPSAPAQAPPRQAAPQARPAPQRQAPKPAQKKASAPLATPSLDIAPIPTKSSPKFIIGAIIAALIGSVFGYAAATTLNNRQLVEMRKNDAIAVRKKLKGKVAAFKEANTLIQSLNGKNVDYAAAAKLKGIDFKVGASVFASNRLLLGGEAITKITQFTTDSIALSSLVKDHDRATNKLDIEEIKKLIEKNKILSQQLGVVYDYTRAAKNVDKEGFFNKPGQLAKFVRKSKEDKNKIVIKVIGGAGEESEVDSRQFIRIRGKDVLRVNGKNALSRYEFRVRNLKYKAGKIAKYVDSIDVALSKISESGDTPAAPAE